MLSIAPVRSAAGAANYFAKDNYYTVEGSSEVSIWAGEGAQELGLTGQVTKDAFERTLNGILPDGTGVAQVENRQSGTDLTFSMPKSASIMAYVAGDRRILAANMSAVQSTMKWVERNLAEGRRDIDGRKVPIRTGNLVYALFEHDTSRALDPQGHIHAVVANLTRMPNGTWQALHNRAIWKANSVIGAIYHAALRNELEKLGYVIDMKGKHGAFEVAGVPKNIIDAFSQRRETILGRAAELGIVSHSGRDSITIRTRNPKLNVEDRIALGRGWKEKAAGLGFTGQDLLSMAQTRSTQERAQGVLHRGYHGIKEVIVTTLDKLSGILGPDDPLVDRGLARMMVAPSAARAQFAVASAVRIHAEREAAFKIIDLAKTALDLGLKGVTIDHVDRRLATLTQRGMLIPGVGRESDGTISMVTTKEALATEEKILGLVEAGRGASIPIVAAVEASARLQGASDHELNAGQLGAARLVVSSTDRTVIVQGIAGAGKSTMLSAVARVAEAEGRDVLGLAFQNKMVADMAEGAGIRSQTIASFVLAHQRFITEQSGPRFDEVRVGLANTMIVVDETSMVSSRDMLKLHQIADVLAIEKLVLVGDRQQLSSIDAGKAFAMIQAGGGTMARMDQNIRQRTTLLRTVASLANVGKSGLAIRLLRDNVIESESPAQDAADRWLGLSPQERERTAVFASGREARAAINERIQEGLGAEGTLRGAAISLTVYERVNLTREELRYAKNYAAGQTLEVGRGGAQDVGLKAGRYDVVAVRSNGKVDLRNGRQRPQLNPRKLSPTEIRDRLQLSQKKEIQIRQGESIRWTANDKPRDLHNAALATVVAVDGSGITIETAGQQRLTLGLSDPMLSRLDLAYSLNMHMAQGITTDKAITVMASYEANLSNQRLFNVGVTRVRDQLTLIVDDKAKLVAQLARNPGNKTSALETVGRLDIDGMTGGMERSVPGGGLGLSDVAPLSRRDQRLNPGGANSHDPTATDREGRTRTDRAEILPALPERSLGLDL
ncbi:conjugative relaxase domain-containing protein, TrwC/TraI family [Sphingobium sp. AP50]|uniref:MobF family relaxase n=1 Tax=Sphingobium sp. AP50 TaxID=1884369 RepID=UPI0008D2A82B|nr:MobF family relaxase [Sphingobium sp. AP50]SEK02244.1 conjugative relaxase domain-containing protein, TrwC/TraI family [Sphingobium sp. AP50]